MLSDTLQAGLGAYRIGAKVRDLRLGKGLALSQLGDHTGLSAGMLSKIERGSVIPTLPTLLRIALVFGVGLDHFFNEDGSPILKIVRPEDRVRLPDRKGASPHFIFESLDYPVNDRPFECFLAEFLASEDFSEPHHHRGDELLYVMRGGLELSIHDKVHPLNEGDAVYFQADFPHSYRASNGTGAQAFVVVQTIPSLT